MKLIVGLGNPGKQYEGTRHNMGFMAVDRFMDLAGVAYDRSGFKGEYGIVKNPLFSDTLIVLKPQTFMNLSGESVQAICSFYKLSPEDVLVIYDEMALKEGQIRLRESGSNAGHKGMGSIISLLGTSNIKRIRIGIGEPPNKDAVNFVLGKPSKESMPLINEAIDNAAKAIRDIYAHSFEYAMNHYNKKG